MSRLDDLLCRLGLHAIDSADLHRRKLRAVRMGVDVSQGLPCTCLNCGKRFWK